MPFTVYQNSYITPALSSEAPNWAFRLMHETGITFDGSNNVTAVTEQSQYGLTATSVSLITRDTTNTLLGIPTLLNTPAATAAAIKFGEYVTSTTRPMLTTGIAYVILGKTSSTNSSSYMIGQGTGTSAIEHRTTSNTNVGNCLTVTAKGGVTVTASAYTSSNWEFRWMSAKLGDFVEVGVGPSISRISKRTTMTSLAESQISTNCPLLLFNKYSSAGTIGTTTSSNISVAEIGIIDPSQVDQCRRYWANKYSLTL